MTELSGIQAPILPEPITPARHLAILRARLILRYRLRIRPSKTEELEQIANIDRGVSTGYAHGQIRIRLMCGRDWLASADFQVGVYDLPRVYAILDPHFGYLDPQTLLQTLLSGEYLRSTDPRQIRPTSLTDTDI